MTNLQAYMAYYPETDIAMLSLDSYAIDPTLADLNQVSSALAMIDKAISADYKQGSTSETMPKEARAYLLSRGKRILAENDVTYLDGGSGIIINATRW